MVLPDPRIVSINELRFRPANSNDRARAGMEHAFKDVPPCSFAKDDGISPYMAADSGINSFPDNPASQLTLHGDVPDVAHDLSPPAVSFAHKLLRSGFGLSVFLHIIAAGTLGYFATVKLPDDTLLAGESVISLQLLSDSEVDSRSAGEEQEVDAPEEKPVEDKVEEPIKVEERKLEEKPVEKPIEQAKLPDPVEEPVKPTEPVVTTEEPEVLATDQPSSFAVEQATRTLLETTEIQPLPETLPDELVAPEVKEEPALAQPLQHPVSKPRLIQKVTEVKPAEPEVVPIETKVEPRPVERKPEPKLVQPLQHPVSMPRVVKKIAEVKPTKPEVEPVETKVEPRPVKKKPEPKAVEKKPEKKKPVEKPKKIRGKRGADESDSDSGTNTPKNKGKQNQAASQGGQKNRETGNASISNYKGLLERKIDRARKRVRVPGKGEVVVVFTVNANGSISNLRIKKSSGKPAVDKAALEIIRKASPFPAIPAELGKRRLTFQQSVGLKAR